MKSLKSLSNLLILDQSLCDESVVKLTLDQKHINTKYDQLATLSNGAHSPAHWMDAETTLAIGMSKVK